MGFVQREIRHAFMGTELVNTFWTCPACLEESNVVEWRWEGKPTEVGYEETRQCPCCGERFKDYS